MTEKDVMGRAMLNITKMMGGMFELFPTRGEMIYHCINMPWRKSNWQGLKAFWGNTKKRQRELPQSIEDQEHKLWARELALETRVAQRQKQAGEAWGQVMRTALGFDVTAEGDVTVV